MSARLLEDQNHFHDIEDDRESALYVLLWTALRYTKHAEELKNTVTVKQLLEAFDEASPDGSGGVMGGVLKTKFLSTNSELRFEGRPQFEALILKLCRAFGFRYAVQLFPEDTERFRKGREILRSENWLVDMLRHFLDADGWPSDDKAEPQETVIEATTSHKRELDQKIISDRAEKRFRSME
jgi:hypothetical protein